MHDEQHESAYSADLPVYVEVDGRVIEKELGDLRLTYVSDCLVISAERTPDGFKALCRKVTKIWIDLLWDGYLCRGGISAGPMIHEASVVIGSAYMNAYKLEAKADVPRIVIDKELTEFYGGFPGPFPVCPPTIVAAQDGFLYLRYFPYEFFPPYAFSWSTYLLRARECILAGLTHSNERVRAKYEFVKGEFNFATTHFRKLLDPIVAPIA
jgi:hypothetical protein